MENLALIKSLIVKHRWKLATASGTKLKKQMNLYLLKYFEFRRTGISFFKIFFIDVA